MLDYHFPQKKKNVMEKILFNTQTFTVRKVARFRHLEVKRARGKGNGQMNSLNSTSEQKFCACDYGVK